MKSILGQKIGMTQIFDANGKVVPVTLIEAGPCDVLQIKTSERDGYEAVQVGFQKIEKQNRIKKPHAKKPFKRMREFRGDKEALKIFELGKKIDVSIFKEGDEVKVSGISKGKGFQGPVKRWGFKGRASVSHGTKHELRTPGSTGSSMPEHVNKGRKMAGHMGAERVSVKNLKIEKIDLENNLIAVRGAVPGRRGTLLEIRG
ncbi:MAG: 50S ribosomal protein L3 [Patescibacteria group bacterium]